MKLNMKIIPLCLLLASVLLPDALTVPVAVENERLVDIQLLSEESNPDARVRREADSNLPDHLSFKVPLTQGEVTLRMKRSRLLPTATSNSDVTTPFSENAAVYTDPEHGASMIVKKQDGDYNMQGSFQHDQTEWHLEPVDNAGNQGTDGSDVGSHRLFPGPRPDAQRISLIGDTVVDDEPPVEVLNLADRNRHRLQRMRARLERKGGNNDNTNDSNQRGATEGDRARRGNGRTKREAEMHTVELVFVVDYADYEKWVNFKGASNAINEMTLWYTYVAETINIRYTSISDPEIAMSTVVTFLRILTTESDDDFIEDLIISGTFDGGDGLRAFRTWYQDPSNAIPNADHYMLFTGFDLRSASGIAFGSRVCTPSGVSITENSFTAGVGAVAAHELGHSLSAAHDAQTSGCSDSTQNIMSTIFSLPVATSNTGNPWKFSSCSIDAFKAYLEGFTCTEPANTGTIDRLPAPTGNNRAGIAQDRNEQCRLYFRDNTSSFCSIVQAQNGGESGLCGGMFCAIPGTRGSCRTMLPQEFTTCGTGKWCRLGFCVDAVEDPTTTETPTTTTTTTTQAPTTTTTTQAPTTTTTTQAPTTTTTTQAPTTTTTTQAPTTTTTTQAPTTTTTTQAPTTTTTTQAPTTTTTTTTTQAPTTTTTTTTQPPTTSSTITTTTTQEPATTTTTLAPTTSPTTRPTTTTTTTTTTERPAGPTSIYDCIVFLRQYDIRGFWRCYRDLIWASRNRGRVASPSDNGNSSNGNSNTGKSNNGNSPNNSNKVNKDKPNNNKPKKG